MRIEFLDAAKSDLTECQNFYRQHGGPALAARMISRIKKSIMDTYAKLIGNSSLAYWHQLPFAPEIERDEI